MINIVIYQPPRNAQTQPLPHYELEIEIAALRRLRGTCTRTPGCDLYLGHRGKCREGKSCLSV